MGDEWEWPLRGWEAVEAGTLSIRELRRLYTPADSGVQSRVPPSFPQLSGQ